MPVLHEAPKRACRLQLDCRLPPFRGYKKLELPFANQTLIQRHASAVPAKICADGPACR